MDYLLFFLIGAVISVLSSFFGVGGGFILTPLLLLIGFSPIEAVVTSLMYTIANAAMGIFAHIRLKNIRWKEGLVIGFSGVVATQLSKPFVLYIEKLGWDEILIPILYIMVLGYFVIRMFLQGSKKQKASAERRIISFIKLIVIGLAGGLISTTLGVGGGFVIVPLLITFLNIEPRKAVGTSLFAVLMIASSGFVSYSMTISPNLLVATCLILGAMFGSQFGASVIAYFKDTEINRMLAVLYFITLISVVLKLLHLNNIGIFVLMTFAFIFLLRLVFRLRKGREKGLDQSGQAV